MSTYIYRIGLASLIGTLIAACSFPPLTSLSGTAMQASPPPPSQMTSSPSNAIAWTTLLGETPAPAGWTVAPCANPSLLCVSNPQDLVGTVELAILPVAGADFQGILREAGLSVAAFGQNNQQRLMGLRRWVNRHYQQSRGDRTVTTDGVPLTFASTPPQVVPVGQLQGLSFSSRKTRPDGRLFERLHGYVASDGQWVYLFFTGLVPADPAGTFMSEAALREFEPYLPQLMAGLQLPAPASSPAFNRRSFADWCRQTGLPTATQQTVNLLLFKAGTRDCNQAQTALSRLTTLDLSPLGSAEDIYRYQTLFGSVPEALTDLRPLTSLPNLTTLYLAQNQVRDISPLAFLPNLKELHLNFNPTYDLSPLANFPKLQTLSLAWAGETDWSNQPLNLEPLAAQTELRSLSLQGNRLTNLHALSQLTQLQDLNLSDTRLTSVQFLARLTNLTTLRLSRNQMTDLRPLSRLLNLTTLELDENRISTIRPLSRLMNLRYLNLMRNQISNISALQHLTQLTQLNLADNQIRDLNALTPLANLTLLELGNNQITDPAPLAALTGLTALNLGNNQITNPGALARLTNLTELSLSYNNLTSLDSLSPLRQLQLLQVLGNPNLVQVCPVQPGSICIFEPRPVPMTLPLP